jgi:nitrogen regulatory protein PII
MDMKRIEAVVHPSKVGDVCAALNKVDNSGIMVTEIAWYGSEEPVDQRRRRGSDLTAQVRLQLIVNDSIVSAVVDAICTAAHIGQTGSGSLLICSVDDAVRIEPGHNGLEAL